MLDKIQNFKNFLGSLAKSQTDNLELSREIEWAHIYHDSIRGKEYLQNLGLNVGRWAGNYSFFYILNRILGDYRPKNILELGLGESSKFISTYLTHFLLESNHTVVEQDQQWIAAFGDRFTLSERSKIAHCPMVESVVKGFPTYSYQHFSGSLAEDFDLIVVDGPYGSDRYSRYDVVSLVADFEKGKEFILVVDDSHRIGEQDTIADLCQVLATKGIEFFRGDYAGVKQNTVLATKKYRFAASM